MTVYLVISLPKIPHIDPIYMVLANPNYLCIIHSLFTHYLCIVCIIYALFNNMHAMHNMKNRSCRTFWVSHARLCTSQKQTRHAQAPTFFYTQDPQRLLTHKSVITCARAHTQTNSHTHTDSHIHPPKNTHTHSHTTTKCAYTHAHTHIHTHTHAHTHTPG